jgi:hypothetical protein
VIVAEVERLHWRIWNGTAKKPGKASTVFARSCRISAVRRVGERVSRPYESCRLPCTRWMGISPARARGWRIMPSATVRARVGTVLTGGTANILVNRRMNKA